MKKRLTKVLALGLTAAMLAGAPLSAMAAETTPVDTAVTSEAVTEDTQAVTDENAEETVTEENADADDGVAVMALTNGVDPMTLEGLVQLSDGNWYYMENGKLSSNADKTVKPACGSWWYVDQLKINFSFKGFGKNGEDLWYVENGQVQFGYTGIATGTDQYGYTTTYYVTNGRVDNSFTGLCFGVIDDQEGWYYFSEGKPSYAGSLVEYNGSWWYVRGDYIDFSYTGAVHNDAGTWCVRNGQVDFGYTGVMEGKNGSTPYQYYFVNGKADENLNGVFYTTVNGVDGWYGFYKGELATSDSLGANYYMPGRVLSNASGWWYINPKTGMVDFNHKGLGITEDDNWYYYWYVENGQINFNYNGIYKYYSRYEGNILCYITNGQVDPNVNGVYQFTVNGETNWYGLIRGMQTANEVLMNPYDGSWWYTGNDGVIDFSYTSMGSRFDEEGDMVDSWYVKNGQIDFSSNGWIKIGNYYVYVQNGKLRDDVNGLIQATIDGKDGWWDIYRGTLFYNTYYYYTLSYYGGNWWAVYDSQIDFSYTGFVEYNGISWYVENGCVNFDKTGFVNTEDADSYAYVQNGQCDTDFNGLVYAELNGKTSWWKVENGKCEHSSDATWSGTPDGFAMNESGLWAVFNGEVVFDVNGEFSGRFSYYIRAEEETITVRYTYQIENGLVTAMQVSVL